jgi:hypothetical protein
LIYLTLQQGMHKMERQNLLHYIQHKLHNDPKLVELLREKRIKPSDVIKIADTYTKSAANRKFYNTAYNDALKTLRVLKGSRLGLQDIMALIKTYAEMSDVPETPQTLRYATELTLDTIRTTNKTLYDATELIRAYTDLSDNHETAASLSNATTRTLKALRSRPTKDALELMHAYAPADTAALSKAAFDTLAYLKNNDIGEVLRKIGDYNGHGYTCSDISDMITQRNV